MVREFTSSEGGDGVINAPGEEREEIGGTNAFNALNPWQSFTVALKIRKSNRTNFILFEMFEIMSDDEMN